MAFRIPGTVPASSRRYSTSEAIVLSCLAGVVVVFLASLFGRPLLGVPVLVAPIAYVALRASRRDAATVLSLHVMLLVLVPSVLIFGPLGASGTPANIVGIGMLWWWSMHRFVLGEGPRGDRNPVRSCLYLLVLAVLASYAALAFRPIVPQEISAADRGLLFLAGCAGITLLAADGLASRARIDTLLRRLAAAGGVLAAIGLYQFVTGFDVNDVLSIPGLTQNQELDTLIERASFERVAGTAAHPIEFGVVMAMLLPVALHFALYASPRARWRWWIVVALMAIGVPISVSRSAIVCLAVASVILIPTWPARWIKRAAASAAVFAVGLWFAVPGLLDELTNLFVNISSDPSTTSRTEDYEVFARVFAEQPVLGRGFFTYLPDVYTTLDNEFLLSLVEIGVVGTLALVAFLIAGIGAGRAARHAAHDDETRHLGQALTASIAAGAISLGTFDTLSFPMAAGLLFLLIGVAGGLRRVVRADATQAWAQNQAALTSDR